MKCNVQWRIRKKFATLMLYSEILWNCLENKTKIKILHEFSLPCRKNNYCLNRKSLCAYFIFNFVVFDFFQYESLQFNICIENNLVHLWTNSEVIVLYHVFAYDQIPMDRLQHISENLWSIWNWNVLVFSEVIYKTRFILRMPQTFLTSTVISVAVG